MWKGPEEFFTYTKNQRNGIFLLIGLAIAFFAVYRFWDFQKPSEALNHLEFEKMVMEWEAKKEKQAQQKFQEALFYFDPNRATNSQLKELGLEAFQIKRINNFLIKGGRFSNAKDLYKIYGIDSTWVVSIIPYVKISEPEEGVKKEIELLLHSFNPNLISITDLKAMGFSESQARGVITFREKVHLFNSVEDLYKVYALDSSFVNSFVSYVEIPKNEDGIQKKEIIKLDINLLDSNQIKNIEGVPQFLLDRILKYRKRLGGFFRMEQLKEVYGVNSFVYQKIEVQVFVNQDVISKINLNEASFKELLNHPYLDYEQVKSILNFRQKIRLFESVNELNQLELINDSLFLKIANYLEVGKNN